MDDVKSINNFSKYDIPVIAPLGRCGGDKELRVADSQKQLE
jgi:hypothetical protein